MPHLTQKKRSSLKTGPVHGYAVISVCSSVVAKSRVVVWLCSLVLGTPEACDIPASTVISVTLMLLLCCQKLISELVENQILGCGLSFGLKLKFKHKEVTYRVIAAQAIATGSLL